MENIGVLAPVWMIYLHVPSTNLIGNQAHLLVATQQAISGPAQQHVPHYITNIIQGRNMTKSARRGFHSPRISVQLRIKYPLGMSQHQLLPDNLIAPASWLVRAVTVDGMNMTNTTPSRFICSWCVCRSSTLEPQRCRLENCLFSTLSSEEAGQVKEGHDVQQQSRAAIKLFTNICSLHNLMFIMSFTNYC